MDSELSAIYHVDRERYPLKLPEQSSNPSLGQNPFWIKSIGEKRWLHKDKASAYLWLKPEDPEYKTLVLMERDPRTQHAGLTNKSCTCYVNSILQAWFHNPLIRKMILSTVPQQEEPTDQEQHPSRFKSLQELFLQLQYSTETVISTESLIESLQRNIAQQEDAVEFSIQFVEELSKEVPELSRAFSNLLQGEMKYVRKCNKCLTEAESTDKFVDLDIGYCSSLEQGLVSKYSTPENISGRNCDICGEQTDSDNHTILTKLPPVLQVQINRNSFDVGTQKSVKRRHRFSYPDRVDFSRFVMGNSPKEESPGGSNSTYVLSAALLHSGRGADHGHYTVMVKDFQTELWNQMNDEKVEICMPEKDEQEIEGVEMYHSKEVYMLMYIQESVLENEKENKINATKPEESSLILERIAQQSRRNMEYRMIKHARQVSRREEIRAFFNSLDVQRRALHPVEDDYFISLDWIKTWLKEDDEVGPIDNSSFICPHDKVKPPEEGKYIRYRAIPGEAWKKLHGIYAGGPELKVGSSLCRICVQDWTSNRESRECKRKEALAMSVQNNLRDFLLGRNRPLPSDSGQFYVVPYTFMIQLKNFTKYWSCNEVPEIQNAQLCCREHGKLMYPIFEVERKENIENFFMAEYHEHLVILTSYEWDFIKNQQFKFDLEVGVNVPNETGEVEDCFCMDCALDDWLFPTLWCLHNYEDEPITVSLRESVLNGNPSKRIKMETEIIVSCNTSVYEVMLAIYAEWDWMPLEKQRLFSRNVDITESDWSTILAELEIWPHNTLYLEKVEESNDSTSS